MRKTLALIIILAMFGICQAFDSMRLHEYCGVSFSFTNPLMLPDGVTPIPDGCLWEIVLCSDQSTGAQNIRTDFVPSDLHLKSGALVDAYQGFFNGEEIRGQAGFFYADAYTVFYDPVGSPDEPALNCSDRYYIRIYNAPSRDTATYYRTSTTMSGPLTSSVDEMSIVPDAWAGGWNVIMNPNPHVATNPTPGNLTYDIDVTTSLGWGYVPDGIHTDPAAFRVYLSTSNDFTGVEPIQIAYTSGTTNYQYTPSVGLAYDTTYYWKVVPTTDISRNQTRSHTRDEVSRGDALNCPVWTFMTESAVAINPTTASNPNPSDSAINVSTTTSSLGWDYIVDALHSNPTGFRVYFGTTSDLSGVIPVEIGYVDGQVSYSTAMPALAYTSHYYWKVVPFNALRNENGTRDRIRRESDRAEAINCPVWDFQTVVGNIDPGQTGGTDFDLGGGTVVTFDPGNGNPAGQIDITIPPTPDPITYSSFNTDTNLYTGTNLFFHIDGHCWNSWPVELTFSWNAPVPTYDTPAIWYNENAGAGWAQLDASSIVGSNLSVAPYWIKVSVNHFSDWTPGSFLLDNAIHVTSLTPTPGTCSINEGASQTFAFSGYDPDGNPLTYTWQLDDANVDTDSTYTYSPEHADVGSHLVSLQVSDGTTRNTLHYEWTVSVVNIDRQVIVGWTFPNESADPFADEGIATNANRSITTTAAGSVSYTSGTTGSAITATGWENGSNTKYWQIELTTQGCTHLQLSSAQRSSGTAPRDFKAQYRVGDAGIWADIPGATAIVVNSSFSLGVLNAINLPVECENQNLLYVRWVMTSNTSVGGSTVSSAGTNRIDDIRINGVYTAVNPAMTTVDFETVGTDWTWTIAENGSNPAMTFPANPHSGGINTSAHVAQFTALASGAAWALTFTDNIEPFQFDATNKIVTIQVYKSVISPVGIKFEGGSTAMEIEVSNTVINQWETISFDFTAAIGRSYTRLVIIPDFLARSADHTILMDNIVIPDGNITVEDPEAPTVAAPVPTTPSANVISVFSDSYTNLAGINYAPNWGQTTTVTTMDIDGNNMLRYTNFNYQGTQFASGTNLSAMTYVHVDMWTPDATVVMFGPISLSTGGYVVSLTPLNQNAWNSYDIPLTSFPGVSFTDIHQLKFDCAPGYNPSTIYVDNIYFYSIAPDAPITVTSLTPPPGACSINEGSSQTFAFVGSDPDGNTLTYAWKLDSTTVGTSSSYTYSPDYTAVGSHSLTLDVSDGTTRDATRDTSRQDASRNSLHYTWTITVNSIDHPITVSSLTPAPGAISIDEGASRTFAFSGYDPDGNPLTYTWQLDDANVDTDSTYTYSPGYSEEGTHTITLAVSDGVLRSTLNYTWNVTVNNIDQAIVVSSLTPAPGAVSVDEGASLVFAFSGYDPDGNTLAYAYARDGVPVSSSSGYTWKVDFAAQGPHTVTLTVSDQTTRSTLNYTWNVTVINRIPPTIGIDPSSLTATLAVDQTSDQIVAVGNTGDYPLEWSAMVYYASGEDSGSRIPWLSLSSVMGTIAAHGTAEFTAHLYNEGLSIGDHQATIHIECDDPMTAFVEIPVTLTALGTPDIALRESTLNFGTVFVGNTAVKQVHIVNAGTSELHVTSIAIDGPVFSLSTAELFIPRGQERILELTYSPVSEGVDDAMLAIYSNDTDENPLEIPVYATSALPPALVASPMTFAFATLGSGTDSGVLHLENPGASVLQVSLTNLPAWLDASPAITQVQAGGFTDIQLTANGDNLIPGTITGSFIITSNAPGVGNLTISVAHAHEIFNLTTDDNEDNALTGLPDHDLDVPVPSGDAVTPVEFRIHADTVNPADVSLAIRANNVTGAPVVRLNGHSVGILSGRSGIQSTSLLSVDPALLNPTLENLVVIEPDPVAGSPLTVIDGQLVFDGGEGNASVRYATLNTGFHTPGSIANLSEEIDGTINAVIRTTLRTPDGVLLSEDSRLRTLYNAANDPFTVSIAIPQTATPGEYPIRIEVANAGTGRIQDIFELTCPVEANVPFITVNPATLDFGPVAVENRSATRTFVVGNTGPATLSVTGITADHPSVNVSPSSFTLNSGQTRTVTAIFDPTALGDVDGMLHVAHNDPNHNGFTVSYHGEGIPNQPYIALDHTVIGFPDTYTVSTALDTIVVSNPGTSNLVITNIRCSSPEFTAVMNTAPIIPGASRDMVISFHSTASGNFSGSVTITSNASNSSNAVIQLTGTAVIAPALSISEASLAATVVSGGTVSRTLHVANAGGTPLVWGLSDTPGSAVSLRGNTVTTPEYLTVPNRSSIQLYGGEFTVECWFRIDSDLGQNSSGSLVEGGTQYLLAKSSPGANGFLGLYTSGLGSGSNRKTLSLALTKNGTTTLTVPNVLALGEWNHVAVTYEGSIVKLYLNGSLVRQVNVTGFVGNTDPWVFGKLGVSGTRWYRLAGALDEIRVWQTARSAEQIATARFSTLEGAESDLGGYWNFDTAAPADDSPNRNDATTYGNISYVNSGFSAIPAWLISGNSQGTLTASEATTVGLSLDASHVYAGNYTAQLVCRSNDPAQPTATIPVQFTVTGLPNIQIASTTLDYGNVFIGATASRYLVIVNTGAAPLILSDIASSLPLYSAVSTFTVAPGCTDSLEVCFTPTATGDFPATLSFHTNVTAHPDFSITLTGIGAIPPHIVVTPENISEATVSGHSVNSTVTIANTEGLDLAYSLSIEESTRGIIEGTFANLPGGIKGMAWVGDRVYLVGYQQSKLYRYNPATESVEAEYPIHNAPFGIAYDGSSLWIGSSNGHFHAYDLIGNETGSFTNALFANPALAWDGTHLLVASSSPVNPQVARLDTDGSIVGSYFTTSFGGHLNQMVWVSSHESGSLWGIDAATRTIYRLTENESSLSVAGAVNYTSFTGPCYALGHNGRDLWIINDSSTNSMLYRIDDGITEFNWLSLSATDGSIPAGSSDPITVELNALNLFEGTYHANIRVESNAGNTPTITIPVELIVSGTPQIVSNPDSLDFGQTYIGYSSQRTITLGNSGTAPVSLSIATDDPQFVPSPETLELSPLRTGSVTVTFTPTSPAPVSAHLTLTGAENPVILPLTAAGTGLPIAAIDPGAFTITTTTGTNDNQTLTLTNSGETNLTYTVAIAQNGAARSEPCLPGNHVYGLFADENRTRSGHNLPQWRSGGSRFLGDPFNAYSVNIPIWNTGVIRIGNLFYFVDFNRDGEGQSTGCLNAYNSETGQITAVYPIHNKPYGITYDGERVWIGNQSGNVYGYRLADLVETANQPIASFSTPVNDFAAFCWTGDCFIVNQAFATSGQTLFYGLDTTGNVLWTRSGDFGVNVNQTAYVPQYSGHEFWAYQNLIENDVILGGRVMELSLSGSSVTIASTRNACDNLVLDSFTHDGKDIYVCDVDGPLYRLDDGLPLSVRPGNGMVAPGDTAQIELGVETHRLYGGSYPGSIYIATNDPAHASFTVPVNLTVQGTPLMAVTPNSGAFQETAVGSTETIEFTVTNSGDDTLHLSSIGTSTGSVFAASPASLTVSPGMSETFQVAFTPITVETSSDSLRITGNAGTIALPLIGHGFLPPILTADPTVLNVELAHGASTTLPLLIGNAGNRNLIYTITPSTGPTTREDTRTSWLTIDPLGSTLLPAENQTHTIGISASMMAGSFSGTLRIASNDPLRPVVTIPVNLMVTGTPEIALSLPSISFGSVLLNHTGQGSVQVTNSGSAVLNVTGIDCGEPCFSVASPVFNLEPGATRTLLFAFTPTVQGTRTATATLHSNVSDASLTLSGYGALPEAAIAFDTELLDFGPVNIGDHASLDLTVLNPGTATLSVTDIQTQSPDLTVNLTRFSVFAGSSRTIHFTYAPTTDSLNTHIAILSNVAGEHTVTALGTSNPVPCIALSKAFVNVQAIEEGTQETTVGVTNTGSASLHFTIDSTTLDIPWLMCSPALGTVAPGDSVTLTLTTDTRVIDPGQYLGYLTVNSDDPANPSVRCPIVLNHSGFNLTSADNADNNFNPTPDGDLSSPMNETAPNAPVEFFLFASDNTEAVLRISAFDVDPEEIAQVFVNGVFIGQLATGANSMSISSFRLEPGLLHSGMDNGNRIRITLDQLHTDPGTTRIDWAQLVFDPALTFASITGLNPDRTSYFPGSTVDLTATLATGLYAQDVRLVCEVFDSANTLVWSDDPVLTLHRQSATATPLSFALGAMASTGDYRVVTHLYDAGSGVLEDMRESTFSVGDDSPRIEAVSTLDFGSVFTGYGLTRNVIVANRGHRALTISQAIVSGSGFTGAGGSLTLNPDETGLFTISFVPTTTGAHAGTLTITSNDPLNPVKTVQLTGTSLYPPVLTPDAGAIAYTVPAYSEDTRTFILRNTGLGTLSIQSVSETAGWLWVNPTTLTIPAGSWANLTLHTSTLSIAEGIWTTNLSIVSNDPEHSTYVIPVELNVSRIPVTADFMADVTSGLAPLTVHFTNRAYTSDGSVITGYAWDFDNNGSTDSTEPNPTHLFAVPGMYSVRLTATNNTGRSHSLLRNGYVSVINNAPILVSPFDPITMNEDVTLTNLNVAAHFADPDHQPLAFRAEEMTHLAVHLLNGLATVIPEANWSGLETITFIADDGYGGICSAEQTFAVLPVSDPPTISAPPSRIVFLNGTTRTLDYAEYTSDPDQDTSLLTLSVTGCDHVGAIVTGLQVEFHALTPGWTGIDTLTVTIDDNSSRLTTSTQLVVDVRNRFEAHFNADNTEIVAGQQVHFTDTTEGNPNRWRWYLDGDNIPDSFEQNPTFAYNIGGQYSIGLVVSYQTPSGQVLASDSTYVPNCILVRGTSIPGGNCFGDWSIAGSPYNVLGQLNIQPGNQLRIMENVVVNFLVDSTFVVHGSLLANGAEFRALETDQWGGFDFGEGSNGSRVTNCTITDASNPVIVRNSSPGFENLILRNSVNNTANSDSAAVQVTGSGSPNFDRIVINGYNRGFHLFGTSGGMPVLTNTRIRRIADSSRPDEVSIGIMLDNTPACRIDSLEIKGFGQGMVMNATSESQLDVHRVSVLGPTGSSLIPTANGLVLNGSFAGIIDNLLLEECVNGITVNGSSRSRAMPVITNTRIRRTAESSRPDATTGILLLGDLNPVIAHSEIGGYDQGIVLDAPGSASVDLRNLYLYSDIADSLREGISGVHLNGAVSGSIDSLDVNGFTTGIYVEGGASSRAMPVITNTRVRRIAESSRTETCGLRVDGGVDIHVTQTEIENFTTGVRLDNHDRAASMPVITNTRIRRTAESSREDGIGILANGQIDGLFRYLQIEGFPCGVSLLNSDRAKSMPVLTNTRIRRIAESSRSDGIGIYALGSIDATLDSLLVEGYETGLSLIGTERAKSMPVLTNTRIRRIAESSRTTGTGVMIGADIDLTAHGNIIDGYRVGVDLTCAAATGFTQNRVQNCDTGLRTRGNGHSIHHNEFVNADTLTTISTAFAIAQSDSLIITNNTVLDFDHVVQADTATVVLLQNILRDTTPISTPVTGTNGTVLFRYNNLNLATGASISAEGSTDGDPMFTNTATGDYSLTCDSPCIDAGAPDTPGDEDGTIADVGAHVYLHRAAFTYSCQYMTINTDVTFTNNSIGHDDPSTVWVWNFGDGSTSNDRDPSHRYTRAGLYPVTLRATTGALVDTTATGFNVVVSDIGLNPPAQMALRMNGSDAILSWSPVTTTTTGDSIAITSYFVFRATEPDGDWELADSVAMSMTNWTDSGAGERESLCFYRVIGFLGSETERAEFARKFQHARFDEQNHIQSVRANTRRVETRRK
jgi:PKD repeat protein